MKWFYNFLNKYVLCCFDCNDTADEMVRNDPQIFPVGAPRLSVIMEEEVVNIVGVLDEVNVAEEVVILVPSPLPNPERLEQPLVEYNPALLPAGGGMGFVEAIFAGAVAVSNGVENAELALEHVVLDNPIQHELEINIDNGLNFGVPIGLVSALPWLFMMESHHHK